MHNIYSTYQSVLWQPPLSSLSLWFVIISWVFSFGTWVKLPTHTPLLAELHQYSVTYTVILLYLDLFDLPATFYHPPSPLSHSVCLSAAPLITPVVFLLPLLVLDFIYTFSYFLSFFLSFPFCACYSHSSSHHDDQGRDYYDGHIQNDNSKWVSVKKKHSNWLPENPPPDELNSSCAYRNKTEDFEHCRRVGVFPCRWRISAKISSVISLKRSTDSFLILWHVLL